MKHHILAIIPARGGSKGIPRKNLRPLRGEPLVVHSIRHALQSTLVTRTVVSTDSTEIADVAETAGSEVIMRPAAISGDTAPSEAALRHVLDTLRENEDYVPDLVVFLQPTSPLRDPLHIDAAINLLRDEHADSLFSCFSLHEFVWVKSGSVLNSLTYNYLDRKMRQTLKAQTLVENGSIYVFRPAVLSEHSNRLGGEITAYLMPQVDSFQVDSPEDLELIEKLFSVRENPPPVPLDQVRLLVLDFDGVMTDNRVMVSQTGEEHVSCHRGDGWGIARLKEAGVEVLVLSTETNPVVSARCRKLGIQCIQGSDPKLPALVDLARDRQLDPERVAYMGNDVNDLECMRWAGVPIAVADAEPGIKAAARLVTSRTGGDGAVREVADSLLRALESSRWVRRAAKADAEAHAFGGTHRA